jgi:DNA-binding PadR family transcriptional regulator
MTLKILLLGLIAISPMPGYDLMKVFENSMLFFWHATHTQIYNMLKEMEKDGLVSGEVIFQTKSPSKKVFSITEEGQKTLAAWLRDEPELPGFKHEFLIKLSFASGLTDEEILTQLDLYGEKLKEKLSLLKGEKKEQFMRFSRSGKEKLLWEMIFENGTMYYENELAWAEKAKGLIRENP